MVGSRGAQLDDLLLGIQKKWLQEAGDRKRQAETYALEFAPVFAHLFARLPLHGAPSSMTRPRALISVLGLSWQPVALMTAWAKPERMLVICTKESRSQRVVGKPVMELIADIGGVTEDRLEVFEAPDEGEVEIYRAVRGFLSKNGFNRWEVAVDPTGGKKSMSISASLAGFLEGMWLVYVDYTQYHDRIPVPGSEYPRLIVNPLEQLGDTEIERIRHAFNGGDYGEAKIRAGQLAEKLFNPREAQALALLADAYDAWEHFQFGRAHEKLVVCVQFLERFAAEGRWGWATRLTPILQSHTSLLNRLADLPDKPARIDDSLSLILHYLAAAERQREADHLSQCVLLLYAAIERLACSVLAVKFGLHSGEVDYSRLKGSLDLALYHRIGQKVFGAGYRKLEPSGELMFCNSLHLLTTLDPESLSIDDFKRLLGLASRRNRCEFEHGFLPLIPKVEDARRDWETVATIVQRQLTGSDINRALESYRFPKV